MGVEQKVYLGPYFEVCSPKQTRIIDRCRFPSECPDPEGKRVDRYCNKCGLELRDRKVERSGRVDFDEIVGVDRLIVCTDNAGLSPFEDGDEDGFIDILIPNLMVIDDFDRDVWCEESQDLTEISTGSETHWMRKRYKKELKALLDAFGQENVRTRWGFITYWY